MSFIVLSESMRLLTFPWAILVADRRGTNALLVFFSPMCTPDPGTQIEDTGARNS
jgi:hypothetical protein